MYGNYEYGSIPYGDSYSVTVTVIIISKGSIDALFISGKKVFLSIAPYKDTGPFTSERKTSTFLSQEKYGGHC